MTVEMFGYYMIVNLIDWYVTGNWGSNEREVYSKLMQLLIWIELNTDNHPEDVGDANDCGRCENWTQVVEGFEELIAKGERIPVK